MRRDGYALNNEELELELRSIAVPVRGASDRVLATLNVGAHAARVTPERMVEEFPAGAPPGRAGTGAAAALSRDSRSFTCAMPWSS